MEVDTRGCFSESGEEQPEKGIRAEALGVPALTDGRQKQEVAVIHSGGSSKIARPGCEYIRRRGSNIKQTRADRETKRI